MKLFITIFVLICMSIQVNAFTLIAHRGASGYLPEHTLEATVLAHTQAPDFIEQDVVLSKDDYPVVLHDIHLETVTNVEQLFPNRHRKDGRYYAIDFTLQELKSLHVHERQNSKGEQVFPQRYQGNAHFTVATLSEHIEIIAQLNRLTNRNIGYYTEIKSPAFHREEGKDISRIVLQTLRKYGLDNAQANIYIQCFDFVETKRIRNQLGAKVKLVQLIAENSWNESSTDYNYLKSIKGMREVASVAQGIGPWIGQMSNTDDLKLADWVKEAQSLGLVVHPYTFRTDALPSGFSTFSLLQLLKDKWLVDGVFTDQVPEVKSRLTQNQK